LSRPNQASDNLPISSKPYMGDEKVAYKAIKVENFY